MPNIDFTHDPAAKSWVASADGHKDFPIQNLPLGIFSPPDGEPRGGVAIGDEILDIAAVANLLEGDARKAALLAGQPMLNDLLDEGNAMLRALRHGLFSLLTDPAKEAEVRPALHTAAQCTMHLPVKINDYTDFYTGIHHATNVGKLFRPDNPLLPNYKYVPIGYHGRSSSIRLSGVDVVRPNGQTKAPDADMPSFGPCKRLDYELEMAIWVGRGNTLGKPIAISEASRHIAGISILNDWSARDIQAWEYQPLGPFLAKNFHSSISPWIVTMDALAPYRVAQPARPEGDPSPLPYLLDDADQQKGALGVTMEVHIRTARMREAGEEPHRLSSGSMTAMYWTIAQLVAHHSSNGCNLQPGDLLGTGTLSGANDDSKGSLLELSNGGKQPLTLPGGETRTFLEDGDEIIITAFAEAGGFARIGFGECRVMILPAP
ncbi:MAG: fumarylacetoacetase [Sphingobium sp.]|nr:fumarylacetoacetase [Sphingobium sp.]MCP5397937.1 fumarylacetoacetase [Sphingomonas sp.]